MDATMMMPMSEGRKALLARAEMVVSRERRLHRIGLRELWRVGLWTDAAGRRRTTWLCGLGTGYSVETALIEAETGMAAHAKGSLMHRRFRTWRRQLLEAREIERAADVRYRRMVAELSGNMPVWDGGGTTVAAAE